MHPRLIEYYNQELGHVREMGAEFAREFPKVAARLGMEGLEVADPYVERLLEGFAFIASRTQLKIEAEFPRFTQHLLEVVYPHYLAPTPAMMVVAFEPQPGDPALLEGTPLPRGSALRSVIPKGEQTACEFRTAHELTLWPIELGTVRYFSYAPDLPLGQLGLANRVRGGLRIGLRCHGGAPFSSLACDDLPFYINGADDVAGPLYELIHGHCVGALVVAPGDPPRVLARLPAAAVHEVGFDDADALLPYDRRSFQGYRLLREYFAFAERFRFFGVSGLAAAFRGLATAECELVLLFGANHPSLEAVVDTATLALYATPVANLFPRRADRIQLSDERFEHLLVVDRARPLDFEVFAVRSVRGIGDDADATTEFRPFYGDLVHHDASGAPAYFTVRREPRLLSERQRRHGTRSSYVGNDVYLSLVDPKEAPYPLALRQLAVEVLATNRDLPLLLPIGSLNALMLQDAKPVSGVRVLAGPSRPRASLVEGDYAWRLVSHLSLNYLSLLDPGGDRRKAAAALRELLALYVDPADAVQRKRIDALAGVDARPVVRRLPLAGPIAFGRGLAITLEIAEDAFGGAGGFLFGSVLEKFLARHVSINSFVETTLRSETRGEVARWPAKAGTRVIA
ncbi:MAG: type VI secretion system baseplate subunit TssF [Lautropia sp.]